MLVHFRNYPSLLEKQYSETYAERVSRLRQQGLLQTSVPCRHRGLGWTHLTPLDTPETESSADPHWYTRCTDPQCPAEHHGKTLHFKQGSIFSLFPTVPLHILERVIWCFSELHPPKSAQRLIGGETTVALIKRVYAHLRACTSAYHRRAIALKPLGGLVFPDSPLKRKCVRQEVLHTLPEGEEGPVLPPDVFWSIPVEVDECRLCVGGGCGVCMHTCIFTEQEMQTC
jgi:hypothetical protein